MLSQKRSENSGVLALQIKYVFITISSLSNYKVGQHSANAEGLETRVVRVLHCFLLCCFCVCPDANSPEGQGFCQAGFSADFLKVLFSNQTNSVEPGGIKGV